MTPTILKVVYIEIGHRLLLQLLVHYSNQRIHLMATASKLVRKILHTESRNRHHYLIYTHVELRGVGHTPII